MLLPIRGAWIEIGSPTTGTKERDSRSPFGERGLKSSPHTPRSPQIQRRSPSGERGFLCRINTLVDVGIVPSILDIRICDGGNDISLVPLVNV